MDVQFARHQEISFEALLYSLLKCLFNFFICHHVVFKVVLIIIQYFLSVSQVQ